MTVKFVASWKVLFQYAGRLGQARVKMAADPTPENTAAFEAALKEHDDYRDFCCKADEMLHFPDISSAGLAEVRPR